MTIQLIALQRPKSRTLSYSLSWPPRTKTARTVRFMHDPVCALETVDRSHASCASMFVLCGRRSVDSVSRRYGVMIWS